MTLSNPCVAFFITPHGYGHATRAAAIMQSMANTIPNVYFHIFTQAPLWIFEESIPNRFQYHSLLTDIGFIQNSPFHENVNATIDRLKQFYPIPEPFIDQTADELRKNRVTCVICDIAPIGILAAKRANIPSVLVENFTWSWIYQAYQNENQEFKTYIELLESYSNCATYHIQSEPVCEVSATCNLKTNPVSRKSRTDRLSTRSMLGINPDDIMILLSIANLDAEFIANMVIDNRYKIVIPGISPPDPHRSLLIYLPNPKAYYHPDLINASDIVISKIGYSTLAEIYYSQARYLFIPRNKFPESVPLTNFVKTNMTGMELSIDELLTAKWHIKVQQLLKQPVKSHFGIQNGAEQITNFLIEKNLI